MIGFLYKRCSDVATKNKWEGHKKWQINGIEVDHHE